jgi:ribonucleoside-diphosphate reductase alpha chain
MSIENKNTAWDAVEKYLVESRYSVLDPTSGEPYEHSYNQIIEERIIPALKKLEHLKFLDDYSPLYNALKNRDLILATPALMSLGNPYTRRPGYFSCYPLGHVEDSLDGIEAMHQKMRKIYTAGGGVGIDLSKLRPKSSRVDNGQGMASGPVGFLPDFDAVTGTTNQGGRRRGALLVQFDWDHPDIKDFVQVKNFNHTLNKLIQQLPADQRPARGLSLSNMNISVNVFGDFWQHDDLLNLIAENMWRTGDPGLLFIDNMLEYSPFPAELEPKFVNPCSEYVAPINTACNLISINVAKIATEQKIIPHRDIYTANRFFLCDVIEKAYLACALGNIILTLDDGYPTEEIRLKTQEIRPVGVGMSGFHTALLLLQVNNARYGSPQAIKFAEKIQAAITTGALYFSAEILYNPFIANKGININYSRPDFWAKHLNELEKALPEDSNILSGEIISKLQDTLSEYSGFYNSVVTSQAPTGSTSLFLRNLDTGIEPFYALQTTRRIEDRKEGWKYYTLEPYYLSEWFKKNPALKERAEAETALKLTPDEQLDMLGAFQKYIHTGVSKTINLPASATVEDVKKLILKAKDKRLKGFTVYRDGSLDNVITVGTPKAENPIPASPMAKADLPIVRPATVFTAKSSNLKAHITLTHDDDNHIREVFVAAGGPGADINGIFTAFGMILSVALRRAPELFEALVKVLCKVRMDQRILIKTSDQPVVGTSLPQAIGLLMKKHQDNLLGIDSVPEQKISSGYDLCPECQQLSLRRDGSCKKCDSCGYSSC